MAAAIGFRPQLWLAIAFWIMTAMFFLLAFGLTLADPAIEVVCARKDGQTGCDVLTDGLIRPAVERLGDEDLRGARVALVSEPHDGSFKQVELRREGAVRVLAPYTQKTQAAAVRRVNRFLEDTAPGQISAFVVGARPDVSTRFGVFPFQLIAVACFAMAVYCLGRRTRFTLAGEALEVRDSRWPLAPRIQRRAVQEIGGVEVVTRIPDGYAPFVSSLPWRNIYRANALAIRTTSGQEVLLSEWSRRSHALHERVAATVRGWLADQGASSNRSS